MHAGFSVLVALLLSLLHHGNISASTTLTADITPAVTVTVTPSVTPSETPSLEPSDTPAPTTVTPTPTATVSPSVKPTEDRDGDDDNDGDGHGRHRGRGKGDGLTGLLNAIFHHDENNERFEDKHGGTVTVTGIPTKEPEQEGHEGR